MPTSRLDDNRLYYALGQLSPDKEELEKHLKERLGDLFDLHRSAVAAKHYLEVTDEHWGRAQESGSLVHAPPRPASSVNEGEKPKEMPGVEGRGGMEKDELAPPERVELPFPVGETGVLGQLDEGGRSSLRIG